MNLLTNDCLYKMDNTIRFYWVTFVVFCRGNIPLGHRYVLDLWKTVIRFLSALAILVTTVDSYESFSVEILWYIWCWILFFNVIVMQEIIQKSLLSWENQWNLVRNIFIIKYVYKTFIFVHKTSMILRNYC